MRRYRKARSHVLSLDSLVDIVSNTVGILIILAVFMALFARLVAPGATEPHRDPATDNRPAEKLLVPWSHPSNKNSVFFTMQGNRLLYVNLPAFYSELAKRTPGQEGYPVAIDLPGMKTRYFPVTNHVFCLEFTPDMDHGETWSEAQAAESTWKRALAAYPREKFFYFFWVAGDSFELFRNLRKSLWEERIEVGWKPVRKGAPLEVCNGFDGSSAFQPQ